MEEDFFDNSIDSKDLKEIEPPKDGPGIEEILPKGYRMMKAKHLRSSSMMPSNEASYIPPVIYLGQRAVDRQKYKENRVR